MLTKYHYRKLYSGGDDGILKISRQLVFFPPLYKGFRNGASRSEEETGDNACEMSPGSNTESYPAFARIELRENPGKNLNQFFMNQSNRSYPEKGGRDTLLGSDRRKAKDNWEDKFKSAGTSADPYLRDRLFGRSWKAPRAALEYVGNVREVSFNSTAGPATLEKLLPSTLLSKNLKVRIYKTVILPVVLYGCETWTLTLREEQRLRVFENKVLRKTFGAKRDEVTGEWRKLHNSELHALYSSPDIIRNIKFRRLRWAGHVARMGESRNAYRVLVGRPRRRWEDNIKMDLREVEYDGRDWINLAQDRDRWRAYVRAAMNLRVP
uniref:Uncharacterized protein n=1 Tax=Periplaneta americana TaxID=6978 RepID=A0ABQ8TC65_PERAM|nr:hypothetical protein ANN_05888 [Periplaneta americana]